MIIPGKIQNCPSCRYSRLTDGKWVCSHEDAAFFCSTQVWSACGKACPVGFVVVQCSVAGWWSMRTKVAE